ncbi:MULTISPECIES: erythromycin resistance leader peptide [Bacillales]|uniref:Erythromycin resistance leader peptide n=1 Tax=Neobacillus paridis TaxID=2803862 RepID=A0ABS1TWR9_9BACI|nr:erythromycin resistance leader peptide [Neobacillus paridis]MBN8203283.1 erythromycin resistance leader peptide [Bacillus sp. NTK034]MBO1581891.1 erythromycin resistance leader peptide [Bacillus sp. XF8]MBU5467022.1 erythromycin resistance leader peptide [Virgibacillus sp. MSJ-26]MBX9975773.1 erythromycin resistance leader peptide [Cytobacillus firmus]UOE57841.1 erythromycin resistance leader peptide [Cytobacillus oceanisediminis]
MTHAMRLRFPTLNQ